MKIDNILLDKFTAQAKESPRLRMNLDLRNSDADSSQRILNAIEPGSVVPIHRHRKTSETVVVLRGRVVEEYYDDAGVLAESFVLGDCHVADAPRNDVNRDAPRNDVNRDAPRNDVPRNDVPRNDVNHDAPRNDVNRDAPHNDVPMVYALNIPAGQWHTLRALESGTVILEMKDVAYEPIQECDILK